ncbi:MAG: hypothetical protein VB858_22775, partial [Planctomycetaceae bacterium]
GTQFATYSGIVNGLPGLYEVPVEFPQIGSGGETTATVAFGNSGETNFRILVSWGDDSFSLDHFSAEDAVSGGVDVINDMSMTTLDGEFVLEFDHFYDSRNLPDPENPGDPIPIRVFAQADPNVLFVRSDDSIIVTTIDDALDTIPQTTLDVVGANPSDTTTSGVKAASPYLNTSETVLPSDLFAELEAGGRIDTLRSAFMPNETQDQQFSEEIFNKESAGTAGTGDPTILDASLEEVLEAVLPAQELVDADNAGRAVIPVETYNFSATGALASVPGTAPSADPIVFELDTFVPPVTREEASGLGESFTFTTNAIEQTISEFVIVVRSEDTAAEERIVWLVVLNPAEPGKAIGTNGNRAEIQLSEEVLDDLPERVYKRLPDGDYQLLLQEAGESKRSRQLIIEFQIRDGKPADLKEPPSVSPRLETDEQQPGDREQDSGNSGPQGEQNNDPDGNENAEVNSAPAAVVVSRVEPGSVSAEDWEKWAGRKGSKDFENHATQEIQAEVQTAGMSSVAALAAGSALLALHRNESWQQEIDQSMAHWLDRRKRRPR